MYKDLLCVQNYSVQCCMLTETKLHSDFPDKESIDDVSFKSVMGKVQETILNAMLIVSRLVFPYLEV